MGLIEIEKVYLGLVNFGMICIAFGWVLGVHGIGLVIWLYFEQKYLELRHIVVDVTILLIPTLGLPVGFLLLLSNF